MAFRPFGKKEDKKGILRLPVDEQKKLFKKAAEESSKRQMEVLERYKHEFGEDLENSR